MKRLLGKRLKKKTLTLSIRVVNTCYEILINTFLRPDQVHFNLKFFYENKTTPSSPSYFCICIFEGISSIDKLLSFLVCWKNLDELLDYKIFLLTSLYN